jgi:TonB family protein
MLLVTLQLLGCARAQSTPRVEASSRRCTAELRRISATAVTYAEDEVDEPTRMISDIPRLPLTDAILEVWQAQSAVLVFVVDTTGQIDPCTVEVRAATHPDFRDAILAVVPQLRFAPARRGGKLVRQRASMPWSMRPGS